MTVLSVLAQVWRWLALLPAALVAGVCGLMFAEFAGLTAYAVVGSILWTVSSLFGWHAPNGPWDVASGAEYAVSSISIVIPGFLVVVAGACMAPTRSLGVKVVAVMLCGVVMALPVVAFVGEGPLVPTKPPIPWWAGTFAPLGAVLGARYVYAKTSTLRGDETLLAYLSDRLL